MPIAPEVYKKIVTAKVYIDDNFRESLDLDRLSREACLSRYHFHRLFTRIYKVTPHQYLAQKRIGQAERTAGHPAAPVRTSSELCSSSFVTFASLGYPHCFFENCISDTPLDGESAQKSNSQ
jgi:transcriptional regulator GlxA family with amidase domain